MAAALLRCLLLLLPTASVGREFSGCFFYPWTAPGDAESGSYRYEDSSVTEPYQGDVADKHACQELCANSNSCGKFTYYPGVKKCWLLPDSAELNYTMAVKDAIAGPKDCEGYTGRCFEKPGKGFPGEDAIQSSQSWPMGFQPRKSACWPRDADGHLSRCRPVEVLLELSGCQFRLPPVSVAVNSTCRDMCRENPMCSAWGQIGGNPYGLCYMGVGINCHIVNGINGLVKEGERLGRGDIRSLLDISGKTFLPRGPMKDLWINVFGLEEFVYARDAVEPCRRVCKSYLGCEFWQLNNLTGCFVDVSSASEELAYPLLRSDFRDNTPEIMAGEYVQHFCSTEEPDPLPAGAEGVAWDATSNRHVLHVQLEILNLDISKLPRNVKGALNASIAFTMSLATGVKLSSITSMTHERGVTLSSADGSKLALHGTGSESQVATLVDSYVLVPRSTSDVAIEERLTINNPFFKQIAKDVKMILDQAGFITYQSLIVEGHIISEETVLSNQGLTWWGWLLVALGIILLAGILAMVVFRRQLDFKKTAKRGLRDSSSSEEEYIVEMLATSGLSGAPPRP